MTGETAPSTACEVQNLETFRQLVAPVYAKHAGRYDDLVARIRDESQPDDLAP